MDEQYKSETGVDCSQYELEVSSHMQTMAECAQTVIVVHVSDIWGLRCCLKQVFTGGFVW